MAADARKRFSTPTTFVLLILVSIALVITDLSGQLLGVPRQLTTWVTNGLYSGVNAPGRWMSYSSSYIQDRQKLLDLQKEREREFQDAVVKNRRYDTLARENSELRQALALVQRSPHLTLVTAELSALVFVPGRNEILINRGKSHGVLDGMAVLDSTGVYGQVVESLPSTSRVILITDRRLAVPVLVERSGTHAVITGVGNSSELVLEHAEVTADIEDGDLLVASGLGGVYPRGYPVGVVTSIEPEASGVEMRVLAEPLAVMHRRTWLQVVVGGATSEVAEE